MNIPWKVKSKLFDIIETLNIVKTINFLQKYITKRSVVKSTKFNPHWDLHREAILKFGPMKTLFEFGAGQNLAQNLYLSTVIDQQILIDLNFILDLGLVEKSRKFLSENCGVNGRKINTITDLNTYGISYLAPADAKQTGLEDNSVDICVSTDTLEHIPTAEIEAIFQELKRILKVGGIISLKIDYSDHYAHTDSTINKLNFLSYSENDWIKYNHANHYQNRLRHDEFKKLLIDAGFHVLDEKLLSKIDTISGNQIHDNFKSSNALDITEGYFCAQKKII